MVQCNRSRVARPQMPTDRNNTRDCKWKFPDNLYDRMDYYEKSQTKRYVDTLQNNEIHVTGHGRVRVLVNRALDKIKVSL